LRGYKNFEAAPHPGDLRHLVEIGHTENAINENGYPEPKDIVLCRVWAAATDAGNQHYRAADVMNAETVINFTIRYRSGIRSGMWVRFQGEKWIISTLGEYAFRRNYLGLKASVSKGVSG
jgi:SPP1 family predicted phage head-tail adaptor